jgi:hypothetical protein
VPLLISILSTGIAIVALYLVCDLVQDLSKRVRSLVGSQMRSIDAELKRHESEMKSMLRRLEQSEATKMDQLQYSGEIAREMAAYDAKIAALRAEIEQQRRKPKTPSFAA